MSFAVRAPAFSLGGTIPRMFSCDGENISPALTWRDAPRDTQSFALIVDDPDAPGGTWTHWIVWNLPGQLSALPQGIPKTAILDNGARQGKNDFGRLGYDGPCPPPGRAHRYYFKLFAMEKQLDLRAGADRSALEAAGRRHVLAQTKWMGIYKR